tara:strand:- start:1079 stop:1408 length:330 start_codon:yes stop_codon:yes gene_type:complete
MAMNRASFAKTLEPGLNTLFGLEYDSYPPEWTGVFSSNTSNKAFEEDVYYKVLEMHLPKMKVAQSHMTMLDSNGQLDINMKQLLWLSLLLRKLKKTVNMARLLHVTLRH